MNLAGYQKLTLQDYPGQIAAICFARGCQLRCLYCQNPEIVLNASDDDLMVDRSFLTYIENRQQMLDSIVISGGEPLLQPDLIEFLMKIRELGLRIKLDTNGILPNQLRTLIEQGLVDYIALDYKNCREHFAETVGITGEENRERAALFYERWQESLEILRNSDISYELRTTVVREFHPVEALRCMAKELQQRTRIEENWYLQSFYRNGPLLGDHLQIDKQMTAYHIQEMKQIKTDLVTITPGVKLRQED